MNWHDCLRELRNLNLPARDYIVVGGAALAARGIRETDDIDLVVTRELFERLERTGWRRKERPNAKPGLDNGVVEAYLDVDCGVVERTIESLFEHADEIDGVRIVDLDTLSKFKAAYGRTKDLRDIEAIETYQTIRANTKRGDIPENQR